MKITYRGWGGHFIGCNQCRFRLNTLIEHKGLKIVVSTVGDYIPGNAKRIDLIGSGRHYETQCFHAKHEEGYWKADVERSLDDYFESIYILDIERKDISNVANEMHERVKEKVIEDINKGKIKRGDEMDVENLYVARELDGTLFLYEGEPVWDKYSEEWDITNMLHKLDYADYMFPDVKPGEMKEVELNTGKGVVATNK